MASRRSLTTQIVVILAVATVVPTLLLGVQTIRRARTDLEREVVRGNLAHIRALGAAVDARLQGARRALDLAASYWADQRTAATTDTPSEAQATGRLLRRLRGEVSLFSALSIVDVDGNHLYGDPVTAAKGLGANSFGGYIGDVVFDDARPSVRVITQARSRTGELTGVFVATLDLQFIGDALAEARLGAGARLLVVDGDGIPVARSDGAVVTGERSLRGTNPAVDRALGSAIEGNLEHGGTVAVYRNLSSFQSQRGLRWALILEQSERDAYALARETTRDTIIVGVVVLALALIFGVALATRLTRPLRDLAARADAIAGGISAEDAPEPPLGAPGEIGVLAQRFEEMTKRIGERERMQNALARGDRLAAVGTMAASVAHEVNNPLTTVLGYAKLLAEDKPDDHPDRAGLDLIAEEAERMKTIVGRLLDYSRSEKPEVVGENADVNELLERTSALLGPSVKHSGITIELDLAKHLPRAAADAHAVQQIFVNLVQNAVQAMPEGGVVTLASGLATGDVAIEVRVTDEGPGVPSDQRENVFEPFYTTKDVGKGTGLGLAVCKHLVTRLGATISVIDAPGGRGAQFVVVIPIEQ